MIIVTFEVCSLHTNILQKFELTAIEHFLSGYRKNIILRFIIQFILEAINFVLSNNSQIFDEMLYLQIQGTAVGTIFSPTCLPLTMGYHEIKLYSIIKIITNYKKFILPVSSCLEQNWKRFLNECFIFFKIKLDKTKQIV